MWNWKKKGKLKHEEQHEREWIVKMMHLNIIQKSESNFTKMLSRFKDFSLVNIFPKTAHLWFDFGVQMENGAI